MLILLFCLHTYTGPNKDRRPFLASDCDNLVDAEKWRRQIIKEVSRKVAEIQNGKEIDRIDDDDDDVGGRSR